MHSFTTMPRLIAISLCHKDPEYDEGWFFEDGRLEDDARVDMFKRAGIYKGLIDYNTFCMSQLRVGGLTGLGVVVVCVCRER